MTQGRVAHISKAQVKRVRSLQQKKFRDETGLFVAEGRKCVEELRKGFEAEMIVYSESLPLPETDCITLIATEKEIEQMSGLRTPQGVIGVFKKGNGLGVKGERELVLALDGVQDPGNLGTIIRTCDWFGVKHIVCSPDTADCYNPKVVQATMGALARVNIEYTNLPQWLTAKSQQPCIYGTLLDGRDMYEPDAIPDRREGIIIMGNEGNGISPAVRQFITHPLRIPSYPKNAETSESLNVSIATAVILAAFRAGY